MPSFLSNASLGRVCALLLACAALALSACSQNMTQQPAPTSRFVLLDGSAKTQEAFKGKVTLVNFWATSCTTCVAEMPKITQTFERYKDRGYQTIAVAMKYDPPSYVVNFAQTRKLPFDVAIDNTGDVAKAWGNVRVTPTTFLVNKRGEVVKQYTGEPNFDALNKLVEELLNEKV